MNKADFRAKLYTPYKIIKKLIGSPLRLPTDYTGQAASNLIKTSLSNDKPCMICRYGNCELNAIIAYLNSKEKRNLFYRLYNRMLEDQPMRFDKKTINMMKNNAGFFPSNKKYLSLFAEKMLKETRNIDILATWKPGEFRLKQYFPLNMKTIYLADLEAYNHKTPWTVALKGKNILVIHPFVESIKKQYAIHNKLFKNPDILPDFELKTLKAIQSAAGSTVQYNTWFDALDYMCGEIDKIDFDIAIIGAGAYGFPLAAHVKKIGKKAVHLAGCTQILFGIKGNRWDKDLFYQDLYNRHWTRPMDSEKPKKAELVENSTYW